MDGMRDTLKALETAWRNSLNKEAQRLISLIADDPTVFPSILMCWDMEGLISPKGQELIKQLHGGSEEGEQWLTG